MLSRVAGNLYWLGRYLERAENMARIAAANYRTSVEQRTTGEDEAVLWQALVRAIGPEAAYAEAMESDPELAAGDWLIFSQRNSGSLRSTIAQARGLARELREHISREVFEEINLLYLAAADAVQSHALRPYTATVQRGLAATVGLYESTTLSDEACEWFRCGIFIERADMTSRIIDAKSYMRPTTPTDPPSTDIDGEPDSSRWLAVLRAAGADEAFHRRYRGSMRGTQVAELLMLEPAFPRSLRFSVGALQRHYGLATAGAARSDVIRVARELALLDLDLVFASAEDVMRGGLHTFMGGFQARLNRVHASIMNNVLLPAAAA